MYRSLLIPLSTGARLHAAEMPCSSRHLGVCQELHKVLSVLSQQFGSIILWAPFAWIQWMEEGTAQLAASSQRASKLGETEKAQVSSSPWVTNAQGLMLSTPGFNFKQRMNMTNQYFSNAETIQNIFYPQCVNRNGSLAPKCLLSISPSLSPEEESLSVQQTNMWPCLWRQHLQHLKMFISFFWYPGITKTPLLMLVN